MKLNSLSVLCLSFLLLHSNFLLAMRGGGGGSLGQSSTERKSFTFRRDSSHTSHDTDHTDHQDFSSHSEDRRKSEQTFQGGYTRWWNSAGSTGSYPRQTVYHFPAHGSPYGGGHGTQEDNTNYRRHDVRYINRDRTTKTMRSHFGDKLKHVSGRRISPRLHAVLRKGRFNKDGGFKRRVLITAARGAVAQTAVEKVPLSSATSSWKYYPVSTYSN